MDCLPVADASKELAPKNLTAAWEGLALARLIPAHLGFLVGLSLAIRMSLQTPML